LVGFALFDFGLQAHQSVHDDLFHFVGPDFLCVTLFLDGLQLHFLRDAGVFVFFIGIFKFIDLGEEHFILFVQVVVFVLEDAFEGFEVVVALFCLV
jgi:hypothetical protein